MAKLLMFSGWSVKARFFDSFIKTYFDQTDLEVVEIDLSSTANLGAWCAHQIRRVDQDTMIVGWSLGGMLAILLAQYLESQQKPYAGLVTLMSAPVFVEKPQWPCAMNQDEFTKFEGMNTDDESLVRAFSRILASGFESPKRILSCALPEYRSSLQPFATREKTLALLADLDVSKALGQIRGNVLMLFADNDALIEKNAVEYLKHRFPQHRYEVLAKHGHYPLTRQVASRILLSLSEEA